MDSILEFSGTPWVNSFGWAMVHTFWQAGIVALIVFALMRSLPEHRAVLRYWVAVAGMLTVTVWAGLTFSLHYFPASAGEVNLSLNRLGTFGIAAILPEYPASAGWSQYLDSLERYFPLMFTAWAAGVLLFSLRLAGGWLYLGMIMRKSTIWPRGRIRCLLEELCLDLNISTNVRVGHSRHVSTPVVLGWIRPMILFPVGMVNGLSTEEVEAILAHELAHIRRNDFLVNGLQSVVETVFFFNPFVWWISSEIRREREHSCDDLAVRVTGKSKVYAHTLTSVQQIQLQKQWMLGLTGTGRLLARVRRLFEPHGGRQRDRWVTAALLILMIGGIYWQSQNFNQDDVRLPLRAAALFSDPSEDQSVYPGLHEDIEIKKVEESSDLESEKKLNAQIHSRVKVIHNAAGKPDGRSGKKSLKVRVSVIDTIPSPSLQLDFDKIHEELTQARRQLEKQQEFIQHEMAQAMKEFEFHMQEMQMDLEDLDISFESLSNQEIQRIKMEAREAMESMDVEWKEEVEKSLQLALQTQQQVMQENMAQHEETIRESMEALRRQEELFNEEHRQQIEQQMKEAEKHLQQVERKLQAFERELRKELIKDGYIDSDEEKLDLQINDDEMRVNGKKVKEKDRRKYEQIRKKYLD